MKYRIGHDLDFIPEYSNLQLDIKQSPELRYLAEILTSLTSHHGASLVGGGGDQEEAGRWLLPLTEQDSGVRELQI